jgi:hypothetical protein
MGYSIYYKTTKGASTRGIFWPTEKQARDSLEWLLDQSEVYDVIVNGQRYHQGMKLPEENNKMSEGEVFAVPNPPENLIKVKGYDGGLWVYDPIIDNNNWLFTQPGGRRVTWNRLMFEFGPLTAVEYKKDPPKFEYLFVRNILRANDRSWGKFSDSALDELASGAVKEARRLVQELKDYYGIEEER